MQYGLTIGQCREVSCGKNQIANQNKQRFFEGLCRFFAANNEACGTHADDAKVIPYLIDLLEPVDLCCVFLQQFIGDLGKEVVMKLTGRQ
ncbi:hypothetical protein [Neiella marina]|uniref:hypothetical protein n=1 Tax=Neiella marina TaxID=508461 RepID=UPI00118020D9|nr:hypothetical protein [Neiella marina]